MRRVRLSKTFAEEAERLLEQGLDRFGEALVAEKHLRIKQTIENHLAYHPRRPKDRFVDIWSYEVTGAPFVLLYDYDDTELRIHLIVHKGADRRLIDLSAIEW